MQYYPIIYVNVDYSDYLVDIYHWSIPAGTRPEVQDGPPFR